MGTLGIGGPSGYAAIEVAKGHAEEGTPSPVAGLKGNRCVLLVDPKVGVVKSTYD